MGNHDIGRFAYFLQQDNPGASPEMLADLVRLGHGLLYLARGQPVVYYGDEEGMVGRGGNDMQAGESMFASQSPAFRDAPLLATTRTGADDKFDERHPFYQLLQRLGTLRSGHSALRTGAMIPRPTSAPGLFAFSRIERSERIEYIVALNNSRSATVAGLVPTSQPAGSRFTSILDSRAADGAVDDVAAGNVDRSGQLGVSLEPLQFVVWRASSALGETTGAPTIVLTTPSEGAMLHFTTRNVDGMIFPTRQEIRAEVTGGDGFAEVTFALARASRPGEYELLGTDDTPPYRIFWRPTGDLAPDERLTFIATVNDLRGHRISSEIAGVMVAKNEIEFGIRGAVVPKITELSSAAVALAVGKTFTLRVNAEGTGSMEYQWMRDDVEIPGANKSELTVSSPGRYAVLVRNLAGTTIGREIVVSQQPLAWGGNYDTDTGAIKRGVR